MLVDNKVLLELKAVEILLPIHDARIMTYLRLSKIRVGLIMDLNVPLIKDGIKRFSL